MTCVVLMTGLLGFCVQVFGSFGQTHDLVIGALLRGDPKIVKEEININDVTVKVVWHFMDVEEVYRVFKTVRNLDNDDSIDIIVILDAGYDIIVNKKSVLETYNKKVILWGDTIPEQVIKPSLEIHSHYFPDRRSCLDFTANKTTARERRCQINSSVLHPIGPHVGKTLYSGPPLLAELVKYLNWKYVIIIHEDATENDAMKLEDLLSEKGVLFAVYNVDRMTADLISTYKQIYDFTLKTEDSIHFIVLCRYDCANNILKKASDFDSKHNANKTVFRNLSRWLVGLYDRANMKCLHDSAHDLDHVVVVSIPEVLFDKKSVFNKTLRMCMFDIGLNRSIMNSTEKPAVFAISFIEEIMKASIKVNELANCDTYTIETLQWKATGREFGTVGYVDLHGNIFIVADMFPNSKYGYNMREFLVSVVEYPPYVIKEVNGTRVNYTGFCLDILNELSRNLNFTYKITEPADNAYGMVIDRKSMTFNGLIGQLQRNEVDMIVADVAIQRDREQVMDFTYPFYFGYTTVMVKKPDPNNYKWMKLLEPFRWEVIVVLGGTLLVAALVVHLLEKFNPYYDQKTKQNSPEEHNCREFGCGFHTYPGAVMWLFGILCNEGNLHMPESVTGRTFVSSWSLFCIVIIATYCGNLIAFLTVTKDKFPFNTLLEMAEKEDMYKWGTIGGTFWEQVLTTSPLPEFKALGDAMRRYNQSDPSVLSKSQAYHLNRVAEDENYAFIGDDAAIEISIAKNCDLVKIKERFLQLSNAFGFPDKSPHTRPFAEQLMLMHESGIMAVWKRRWWPDSNRCSGNIKTEAKAIELIDVQSAFYILLGGVFISGIILLIEFVIYKRRPDCCKTKPSVNSRHNIEDEKCDT